MALTFEGKKVGSVNVLTPNGKIVIGNEVTALREKVKELLQAGEKNILLNLANVHYIDSTGIGVLVGSFASIQVQGGMMKLCNLTGKVEDLMVITKLSTVFDAFKTEEEGINSFCA
jgi:anti-sigma B factor antagonist